MKQKLVRKNILIFYINVQSNYKNMNLKLNFWFREMKITFCKNYITQKMTESAKQMSQYFNMIQIKRQEVIFKY